ncbi:MAG: hypothetical protein WCW35_13860 [Bacteroidota bacterium]
MMSVLLAYFRTPRVQIAALLYFIIAGVLSQIPLFNYLGYEFSAIMTIPAAFISGILTILFLKEHSAKPLTRRTWLYVIGDYLLVNLLLLQIPFLIITVNALAVKNCAYLTGAAYYWLLPVTTMVFSVSLALVVGTLFRHAKTIVCLLITGILFHIVVITYFQPQLFAYNFILGFFPGITYDETLSDFATLVLYRQFTLIAAVMMIAFFVILLRTHSSNDSVKVNIRRIVRNMRNELSLWSIVVFAFCILSAGHFFRDVLGFEYSVGDIRNSLGRRSESIHFIIYYQANDYSVEDIRRIKAVAEYQYRKVSEALDIRSHPTEKIFVFIYPDNKWKQRYIGTSNTNIAKPWKKEIHLTTATFSSTFRHELVHILAAEFGMPVINASTRMALNEGLAVAVDWEEGLFTPHQYAAAIHRENGLENVSQLFTYTGFAARSSGYAYLVAGSFSRYLLERFGIHRYRRVFPDGNFMGAFGESLESLVKDWKAFLKTVDATEIPRETVRSLFFQPSIFFKTCAREVAEQNQRAAQAIRVKEYRLAENGFNAAFENAPTAFALRGIFQSLNSQNRPADVIERFSNLPEQSMLRSHPAVLLLLGDALYLINTPDAARKYYQIIREMNYSESFIEATAVRMQCLQEHIEPRLFHLLYYGGLEDSTKAAIVHKQLEFHRNTGILRYFQILFSRNDIDCGQYRFEEAEIGDSVSKEITYFSYVRTANTLFTQNQFEEAKGFYWLAKNFVPFSALSEFLDERIELCDFAIMELQ